MHVAEEKIWYEFKINEPVYNAPNTASSFSDLIRSLQA